MSKLFFKNIFESFEEKSSKLIFSMLLCVFVIARISLKRYYSFQAKLTHEKLFDNGLLLILSMISKLFEI